LIIFTRISYKDEVIFAKAITFLQVSSLKCLQNSKKLEVLEMLPYSVCKLILLLTTVIKI